MGILDEIIAHKRNEVAAAKRQRSLTDIKSFIVDQPLWANERPFLHALKQLRISMIAEIKRKSPSGGVLQPDLDPADIASLYEANHARAISVLTDQKYFGGSNQILQTVKQATRLPVLRKEFIIDPYQIYEARAIQADAILLIVRVLSPVELAEFLDLANELDLDCLAEVHDAAELDIALNTSATIIGINNRNLDTLTISLDTSLQLRERIPADRIAISESGIKTHADVERLDEAGFDGILVGETLMRHPDPGEKIRELLDLKI